MKPLLLSLALCVATVSFAADDSLATLRKGHPRLLVTDNAAWTDIRSRQAADPLLAGLVRRIESDARAILTDPPVERKLVGRRLLGTSRLVLYRTLMLGAAYRLTGDKAFAERAEKEMLVAAGFTDWNPSHFLDVGEMTAALAFGYDWLNDTLSPEARAAIRTAIVEKGIKPALQRGPNTGWQTAKNNWNQVCFGGLTLGALAVGDEEPAVARQLLDLARKNISNGLQGYVPDGVYPEGPSYWGYGTSYQVLMIAALESALGTDWNLTASPGFLASAGAYVQSLGPTGLAYNYSDGGEGTELQPALFWFAHRLENPGLLSSQASHLAAIAAPARPGARTPPSEQGRFLPLTLLWWSGTDATTATPKLPLAWHGEGHNPIAVFRTAWNTPRAGYLALKAGTAKQSHAHMDAGSFVFEADGVRWADDLGAQDYNSLESKGIDLWNMKQDSPRWTVFRLNNRSHNTLTIDDRLFQVDGVSRITAFSATPGRQHAIVDLTPVFAGQATRVVRGFRVVGDGSVLIRDELAGATPAATIRWAMVTRAEIELDGAHATLRQKEKRLDAYLLSMDGARFEVIPADPPADGFNAPNPGRRILVVTQPASANGTATFNVWLKPGSTAGTTAPSPTALSGW